MSNRRFIQIIDLNAPHRTGFVFEVKEEKNGIIKVHNLIDEDGTVYCTSAWSWNKDVCFEIKGYTEHYYNILLKQTIVMHKCQINNQ